MVDESNDDESSPDPADDEAGEEHSSTDGSVPPAEGADGADDPDESDEQADANADGERADDAGVDDAEADDAEAHADGERTDDAGDAETDAETGADDAGDETPPGHEERPEADVEPDFLTPEEAAANDDPDFTDPSAEEPEFADEADELADFEEAREAATGPTPTADEQESGPGGIGDEPAGVGAEPPANAAEAEGVAAEAETDVEIDDSTTVGAESEPVVGSGPAEDQEMPLQDHVEEMVRRLAAVVAVAGVATAITFPFGEEIINFLWYSVLPGSDVTAPHIYSPPELLITQLKVASLAGVIVALPVLVYESYRFMRPGLYPHERRYYLAAVPTSLVLAFVGVTFAYFIVLPAIFTYFYDYTEGVAGVAFALGRTFDLILVLMGYLALVFQIPLFIMLAMMMGLVTRRWLVDRRLLFWGAFLGISFLFSPDPTGMAPIIVTVTMIGLYEGTLLVAKWAGKK